MSRHLDADAARYPTPGGAGAASPFAAALILFRTVRRPRPRFAAWLALVLLPASPIRAAEPAFVALKMPGSQLIALSHDGLTAAGALIGSGSGGFRWSASKGLEALTGAISVQGLSASGRYVAGSSLDADQREVASYWNDEGRITRLGGLPGSAWQSGMLSIASGVSDEPRVVGSARDAAQRTVAFEWSPARGMQPLALPPLVNVARAAGISDDGRRIFGWIEKGGARHGVIWNDGAPKVMGGELMGASRDLHVLLGLADAEGRMGMVYRWSDSVRGEPLSPPRGLRAPLWLYASSDDGSVFVGSAGTGAARTAVIWTADTGFLPLGRLLSERGIAVPPDWALTAATAVSGDGLRIGGWGQRGGYFDSFVVDVRRGGIETH